MVLELFEDNLESIINEHPFVVVQYSATWCGNCRIMKPKFKKLASEMPDASFVIVDAEKFAESRKFVNQIQTNKFDVLKDLIDEASRN